MGSTVGDVDVSADGTLMAVSTYAGFLALFRLDAGTQAPRTRWAMAGTTNSAGGSSGPASRPPLIW